MAGDPLAQQPDYATRFHQAALSNLEYLYHLPTVETLDAAGLDQERESLVRTIHFALEVSQAWPLVCRLIEAVSPYMERRGYWAVWEQILTQALHLARQRDDAARGTTLSLLLARLSQRQTNIKQTIQHYRQTLYFARRCGDQYNEARACTNMGFYYIERGHWQRAEVLCYRALWLFEQLDNDYGQAHTHNHLGVLRDLQHRWDEAQLHLSRACNLWQAMGDTHGLMRGLINLGTLFTTMGQPKQALPYLKQALVAAKSTGEEIEVGTIYMSMGFAHNKDGNHQQGERYARRAEAIFKRHGHLANLALVWSNLGVAYLHQSKAAEALVHFEASLQQWRDLKNLKGELDTLTDLIEYELTVGDQEQARNRLAELEALLHQHRQNKAFAYLFALAEKYGRSLGA